MAEEKSSTINIPLNPKSYTTPILVILLVIASFFVGSLYTRVKNLEQQISAAPTPAPQVAGTQTTAPQPTVSLSNIKNVFSKSNVIKFGDANNKLLLVEVGDPSCPYCHAATGEDPELNRQMGTQFQLNTDGGTYVAPVVEMRKLLDQGKASFAYIYQRGHGQGDVAMLALYCANESGKFWQVHDKLMTNAGYNLINNVVKNDKTSAGKLADFVSDVIDPNTLTTCIQSGKYDTALTADIQLAQSLGANATPSFFVNATTFAGAYNWNDIKPSVDAALK